jgi:rhodanese-related sulfurtransferase
VVALERAGYRNVWHFKDGLREWMDAGYPIEGTMAHSGP